VLTGAVRAAAVSPSRTNHVLPLSRSLSMRSR
jgi:hypothetical protein